MVSITKVWKANNLKMDYSSNFRNIFFLEDTQDDPDKVANKHAKCLSFIYENSVDKLDNESICLLLEDKLINYHKEIGKLPNQDDICLDIESHIDQVNIPIIINNEECGGNDFKCENTDEAIRIDFQEFIYNICNKPQTFEKNITPQIRTMKENTCVKQNRSKDYGKQNSYNNFRTATEQLSDQSENKYGSGPSSLNVGGGHKRQLGTRRNINSKFVSPLFISEDRREQKSEEGDERLKNIEPKMIELIRSEIMDTGASTDWNDIAGLEFAKTSIQEIVVWPMLRPDIFTGLRQPPKGILLFGPPGTGKTLIGKCVASQSKSTFFSISASSLTSKWIGDGEKMVRALFSVARCHQPAVIFIDEIDSLLAQRSDTEHESSRRIKTEFLVQLDGATTDNEERLLVIGATNRPQELDEAARRRFGKRLYIPLPDFQARLDLLHRLISGERHCLDVENFKHIANLSDGYSGADIRNLCSEAALGPIRSLNMSIIEKIQANDVRPLTMEDFDKALLRVKSSVSPTDLEQYVLWDNTYGSGSGF